MYNIFKDQPDPANDEITEILKECPGTRIETIYSKGQVTDWMTQDEDELVLLIQGRARIDYNDDFVELDAGDVLDIPAGTTHRVGYTSTDPVCIWLCVFTEGGII